MASLWERVTGLPRDRSSIIHDFYNQKQFPIEVREQCAEWIESNFLGKKFTNTEQDTRLMELLHTDLIESIETKALSCANNANLQQPRLFAAAQALRTIDSRSLCLNLKECIELEIQTVKAYEAHCKKNGFESPKARITNKMQNLDCLLLQLSNIANYIQGRLTDLQTCLQRKAQASQALANPAVVQKAQSSSKLEALKDALKRIEDALAHLFKELPAAQSALITQIKKIFDEIKETYEYMNTEFLQKMKWSANLELEKDIPLVSNWCSTLADSLMTVNARIRQVINDYATQGVIQFDQSVMQELETLANEFLAYKKHMVPNLLVVDKQCFRVIKKDTKIPTSVQFLAGDRFLPQRPADVTAEILNAPLALKLMQSNNPNHPDIVEMRERSRRRETGAAKLSANTGQFTSDKAGYRCSFANMVIQQIVRASDTRSGNRAMNEKFCILYKTSFDMDGETVTAWCCSAPFAYMVHLNQKTEGMATIFWDDAFRNEVREPFVVPEEVPIDALIEALNDFFKRETETSWNLTAENKMYLKEKLIEKLQLDPNEKMVNMHKFCVAHLKVGSTREMSFWDWFYNIVELTHSHMKNFWDKGYIVGFISRAAAEATLSQQEPQTALLRFSDTQPGAVSISHVYENRLGVKQINSLQPFNNEHLRLLGLARRMTDMSTQGHVTQIYHYRAVGPNSGDGFQGSCVSDVVDVFGNAIEEHPTNKKEKKPYLDVSIMMIIPGVEPAPNGRLSQAASPARPESVASDVSSVPGAVWSNGNPWNYNADYSDSPWLDTMDEYLQMEDPEDFTHIAGPILNFNGASFSMDGGFSIPSPSVAAVQNTNHVAMEM